MRAIFDALHSRVDAQDAEIRSLRDRIDTQGKALNNLREAANRRAGETREVIEQLRRDVLGLEDPVPLVKQESPQRRCGEPLEASGGCEGNLTTPEGAEPGERDDDRPQESRQSSQDRSARPRRDQAGRENQQDVGSPEAQSARDPQEHQGQTAVLPQPELIGLRVKCLELAIKDGKKFLEQSGDGWVLSTVSLARDLFEYAVGGRGDGDA